jgi:TetR/AcrR family transcriptional regulator, cholesterol catabolism regulator
MKNKIKEVAAALIAEKGYTRTSMREIAEGVGLTKAAIYHHYPSKEAILECIVIESLEFMNQSHIALEQKNAPVWDIIEEWVENTVAQAIRFPNARRLIFYVMTGRFSDQVHIDINPYMELSYNTLLKVLQRGISERVIRDDIPVDVMSRIFFATINGALMAPMLHQTDTKKGISKHIMKFLTGGLQK